MAISTWLVVVGVCLLYVALGLWAVTQIFPRAQVVRTKRSSANSDTKRRA